MYIRRTQRTHQGKTCINHLLVESAQTPKGPRQRTICSLGSLEPAPMEQWRILAHKLEAALQGQYALDKSSGPLQPPRLPAPRGRRPRREAGSGPLLTVAVDSVSTEEHREAGPVHVGHQLWQQLGVEAMLDSLEQRTGKKPGSTVVVDRGMAFEENLRQIRARGLHYIVAGRQTERHAWWADFEDEAGWEEVRRQPSPRNPFQHKSRVQIKRRSQGEEVLILCRSDGREEKDRAIRDKQENRFLDDPERLRQLVARGRLQQPEKIHQALGRLEERYPRVAPYYRIDYEAASRQVIWQKEAEKKVLAVRLDGSYPLKTDRQDLTADEIWRTYILLTRVESALRSLKSPRLEHPIFHQLQKVLQLFQFISG